MQIAKNLSLTLFNVLLLYVLLALLSHPDNSYFVGHKEYRFGKGNASDTVRAEILHQLVQFQDGYTKRDTSILHTFVSNLVSADSILILGTMPREIRITSNQATQLIEDDWRSWGDCRFLMENANISASGATAWFTTIGTVRMDGIGLLLPLRLSGVMVKESETWKFQQMQFQFDLDLSWLLLVEALLLIWLIINITLLIVHTFRAIRKRMVLVNS